MYINGQELDRIFFMALMNCGHKGKHALNSQVKHISLPHTLKCELQALTDVKWTEYTCKEA